MHTIDATMYRRPGSLRVLAWFLSILLLLLVLVVGKECIIEEFMNIPIESRVTVSKLGDNLANLLAIVLLLVLKKLWHKDLGAALRHEWGARWPSIPRTYLIATAAIAAALVVLKLVVPPPATVELNIPMFAFDFLQWLPGMFLMLLLVYGTLQHRWLDAPLWKNVLPVCLILFLHPLADMLSFFISPPEDPVIMQKILLNYIWFGFAWTVNAGLGAALYRETRSLSPVLAYIVIFYFLNQICNIIG